MVDIDPEKLAYYFCAKHEGVTVSLEMAQWFLDNQDMLDNVRLDDLGCGLAEIVAMCQRYIESQNVR